MRDGENGIRVGVEGRLAAHSDELLMSSTCRHQLNQLQHQAFALHHPAYPWYLLSSGITGGTLSYWYGFSAPDRLIPSHAHRTRNTKCSLVLIPFFPHVGRWGGVLVRIWRCCHSAVGLLKMSSPVAYLGHVHRKNTTNHNGWSMEKIFEFA